MLPSPGRLNRTQCGCGHEKRVYLSSAGVVSVITVLLGQGMDCKRLGRRQLRHVTILQDYPGIITSNFSVASDGQVVDTHCAVLYLPE